MTIYVQAPASEEIRITNLYSEPMFVEDDPKPGDEKVASTEKKPKKPAVAFYWRFLLERTMDPKFFTSGGPKEGIDGQELRALARKQIMATRGSVGVHMFDFEVASRLQACILAPTGGLLGRIDLEHNWYEWSMLWKPQLTDKPPAVMALAEEQQDVPQGAQAS